MKLSFGQDNPPFQTRERRKSRRGTRQERQWRLWKIKKRMERQRHYEGEPPSREGGRGRTGKKDLPQRNQSVKQITSRTYLLPKPRYVFWFSGFSRSFEKQVDSRYSVVFSFWKTAPSTWPSWRDVRPLSVWKALRSLVRKKPVLSTVSQDFFWP